MQVGDPLELRFDILDPLSPYEIFVRDLVAKDGNDQNQGSAPLSRFLTTLLSYLYLMRAAAFSLPENETPALWPPNLFHGRASVNVSEWPSADRADRL